MLVTELVKKLNFHDSYVNKLVYKNGTVILNITLCMWKQKEYHKNEPELKKINLKFLNLKDYYWDSDKREIDIDYDTIITFTCENNIVKIVLEDGITSILTFECSEVEIE